MFNLFSKKKQTPEEEKINDEILAVMHLMIEAANIDEMFEELNSDALRFQDLYYTERKHIIHLDIPP